MPDGPGTYGSKKGRPKKKDAPKKKDTPKKKAGTKKIYSAKELTPLKGLRGKQRQTSMDARNIIKDIDAREKMRKAGGSSAKKEFKTFMEAHKRWGQTTKEAKRPTQTRVEKAASNENRRRTDARVAVTRLAQEKYKAKKKVAGAKKKLSAAKKRSKILSGSRKK